MKKTERQMAKNWLGQFGVQEGEYLSMTKAQLRTQQRPDKPLNVQVWSTGMLHTAAYQGEEAKTMRNGRIVPLTPNDIIKELHQIALEYFKKGGIQPTEEEAANLRESKETIRRALQRLEEDGVCRRTDSKGRPLAELSAAELKRLPSGNTRIFFSFKPKNATEKTVAQEWQERKAAPTTHEVDEICLRTPSIYKILNVFQISKPAKSQLKDGEFQARVIHAYETARAAFIREIEVDIACLPTQVDTPRPLEVDTPGGAFEIKHEIKETPIPQMQAAGRADTATPESLPPANLSQELARRKLSVGSKMLTKIVATLNDCPVFYFLEVLDRRAERGAIGTGLLAHIAEDAAREYQAMCTSVDEVA